MAKRDKKPPNQRKTNFIRDISLPDIENSDLVTRCKFNFSYLDDTQEGAQNLSDWNQPEEKDYSLVNLLKNIREYTKHPLKYWIDQDRLTIYGLFPKDKSQFKHPINIPHEVEWGRFRLSGKVRLAGFIIPPNLDGKELTIPSGQKYAGKKFRLCANTFYVVFLDKDHLFYKSEKKHT